MRYYGSKLKEFSDLTEEEQEKIQAKELIDFALLFARNNSKQFFQTMTAVKIGFSEEQLNNLTYNYIHCRQLKFKKRQGGFKYPYNEWPLVRQLRRQRGKTDPQAFEGEA